MSRHLDNLERLFNRLHLCIGSDDELTQQARQDVLRVKRTQSLTRSPIDCTISYRQFIADITSDSRLRETQGLSDPHDLHHADSVSSQLTASRKVIYLSAVFGAQVMHIDALSHGTAFACSL